MEINIYSSPGYTLMVKCKAGPNRDAVLASLNQYVLKNFKEAKLMYVLLNSLITYILLYFVNSYFTITFSNFYGLKMLGLL